MRILFLILSWALLLTSCISATTFKTKDPEAQIFIEDSKETAQGKLAYRDRQWIFGHVNVRVEKKGCQTLHYQIHRADDFAPEGLFLGVITGGLGLLWMGKYWGTYDLDYQCTAGLH